MHPVLGLDVKEFSSSSFKEESWITVSLHVLHYTLSHYMIKSERQLGCLQEAVISQRNLPSSWFLLLFPWRHREEQKTCLGSSMPLCLVFGELGRSGFGSMWTLKQHPAATTSQQQSRLDLESDQTRTGWSQRWPGEKKTRD